MKSSKMGAIEDSPVWFEGSVPEDSYHRIFKWGASDLYKHPNRGSVDLLKKTFALPDDYFKKPVELGLGAAPSSHFSTGKSGTDCDDKK